MNKTILSHLGLLLVNLIYGLNFSIAKDVMPEYLNPSTFILLRVVGALSLFWLIQLFITKQKIHFKDWITIVLCAMFGVSFNQLLFFEGLAITSPINGAIIMTSTPIFVMILAILIHKEHLTIKKTIGTILSLTGALLIILQGKNNLSISSDTLWGDILVLLNSISYALSLVLVKPLLKKYNPLQIIFLMFLIGSIIVTPFGITSALKTNWAELPQKIILAIIFVVLFTTFVTYLLNTVAAKYVSASVVGIYVYSQPLFATIFALMMGKDHLTNNKIIAATLIFIGVYLVGNFSLSNKTRYHNVSTRNTN